METDMRQLGLFSRSTFGEMQTEVRDFARNTSGWMVVTGVLQTVLGFLACAYVSVSTIASVYIFGGALILGAVFQGVNAFNARKWTSALLDVFACALYVVAAIAAFRSPVLTAASITLVLSTVFMIQGIVRLVGAFTLTRHKHAMFLNGLATFALGLIVFVNWPGSSVWLLGMMIGVDVLLSGITMILDGVELRKMSSATRFQRSTTAPA